MEIENLLVSEIELRRKEYRTENYPMSIGELISMYSKKEVIINPEFQRYFRWTENQKTKLIESILLGIPIPSIFIYQRKDGRWEIVDGLQRISTILQFVGELDEYNEKNELKGKMFPLILKKTNYLKSLDNIVWDLENTQFIHNEKDKLIQIPDSLKLFFKRSKLNFIIILPDSDKDAKFEVFQRLNKGGTFANYQELRNCTMVMISADSFEWLKKMSQNSDFISTISLSDKAIEEQDDLELILKYINLVFYNYDSKKDVSENLDDTVQFVIKKDETELINIASHFEKLFLLLNTALGDNTFKKATDGVFKGKFLESAFEAITTGLGYNLDNYNQNDIELIREKVTNLWKQPIFIHNSGSGLNAKGRIPKLIPFSKEYFKK